MWTSVLCLAFISSVVNGAVIGEPGIKTSPRDLRRDLFKNYDKKTIPVKNKDENIRTETALSFLFLREFMEVEEILVMDTWIKLQWNDSFLTWDPEQYDGIKMINIPSEDVWKPDITAYTASPDIKLAPQVATKSIVYNTGSTMWVPPLTLSSRCPMDFTNYPNDVQRCRIKLGSWTYSDKSIDLQLKSSEVDLANFVDNNQEWTLVSATVERKDNYYPCCPNDNYPSIDYNITLKRRSAPNLEIARTISAFALFLNLLMFWLPPDATQKVIFGMLAEILIALAVMYLGLSIRSPSVRAKATEKICPFMWIVAAAIIAETLVLNLGRVMGPCRPPRCLAAIAKGCCQPFCVCISRPYPGGDLRSEVIHTDKIKKHVASAQEEWNLVAMMFDRILFIITLLTSVFYYYIRQ